MESPTLLVMWVIYESPSDFPGKYVAREHARTGSRSLVSLKHLDGTLDELRERFRSMGLVNVGRMPDDDPVIKEVWL